MNPKVVLGVAVGWTAGCLVTGAIARKAGQANMRMIAKQSMEVYRPVFRKMVPYVPMNVLEEIATDAAFEDIMSQEGLK